ncbi:DUF7576 family protein [Natronorubrum sp. FCH18a]|uniref:DUF7576 family protein n=1 Tax=Natronorubrum sp. FCH18a TaxID=3447018 RepID=UPI003F519992
MTSERPEFWNYCAHCGAELGLDDWPPVVELVHDIDDHSIYSFCDDGCKAAWNRSE